MTTSAITGLTSEQQRERERLAKQRSDAFFGAVGDYLDPTDPLNYLGVGGKTGAKVLAGLLGGLYATDANALVGKRFKTGTATNVPFYGIAREISDTPSKIDESKLRKTLELFSKEKATIGDVLNHPSLFRDYPELAKVPVGRTGLFDFGTSGAFGNNKIYLNPSKKTEELHSTLLHEIQHAIQEIDKMPLGGSPSMFLSPSFTKNKDKIIKIEDKAKESLQTHLEQIGSKVTWASFLFKNKEAIELAKANPEVAKLASLYNRAREARVKLDEKSYKAFENYKKIAGEAQARAVQKRFENPSEYVKDITESYDVPLTDLLRSPLDSTIK